MSYGNEGGSWLTIIFGGLLAVGAFAVAMSSCEATGAANAHVKDLLEKKGYQDVRITGAENTYGAPVGWACGDEDYHLIEFTGTNAAGNVEEGFVCCGKMEPVIGYSKGCTIRN
jgi:hypothetical protein